MKSLFSVGQNIHRIRESKGYTLQTFFDFTDIAISNMSQIEKGKGNPTLKMLFRIADFLEVDIKELFVSNKLNNKEI